MTAHRVAPAAEAAIKLAMSSRLREPGGGATIATVASAEHAAAAVPECAAPAGISSPGVGFRSLAIGRSRRAAAAAEEGQTATWVAAGGSLASAATSPGELLHRGEVGLGVGGELGDLVKQDVKRDAGADGQVGLVDPFAGERRDGPSAY